MHANAPLTVRGRMILVGRIASGRPVAHVAAEMGISRKTADKWWKRWLVEGEPGLEDRSSRPRRCPHQTPARLERRIIVLRQRRKLGPARIASIVSLPTSTVHRVLSRHGLNRLAWMDRPSGRVIRRIQTDRPGELVHIDVKKLGRIPPVGAGGPMVGATSPISPPPGWGTTSSTRPSTPIAGWPSQKSFPTKKGRPAQDSSSGPRTSSAPTGSSSRRCSPTTPGTTWARTSPQLSAPSNTEGSDLADLRPMEKWNASTAPCSKSGPTCGSTPQMPSAPELLTAGSTPTTIIGVTRPSEAGHPSR